jgi:hypothetical protein
MVLSSEVNHRCRQTLLKCHEFDSNETLRPIFNVEKLAGYKADLPSGKTKAALVDAIMDFLLEKRYRNESVFIIFLQFQAAKAFRRVIKMPVVFLYRLKSEKLRRMVYRI